MKYGALGLVEVIGSSNAVKVIDQMLKAAEVEFRTWYGKCGGHETVFMSGEVAAVQAAIDHVNENPPCEIILAVSITNPSEETERLVHLAETTHKFVEA